MRSEAGCGTWAARAAGAFASNGCGGMTMTTARHGFRAAISTRLGTLSAEQITACRVACLTICSALSGPSVSYLMQQQQAESSEQSVSDSSDSTIASECRGHDRVRVDGVGDGQRNRNRIIRPRSDSSQELCAVGST